VSDWTSLYEQTGEGEGPRDLAVFLRYRNGKLTKGTIGALTLVRDFADQLGAYVIGVKPNASEGSAEEAGGYGADKVYTVSTLAAFVEDARPSAVFFVLSEEGIEQAARLAERLQVPVVGAALRTELDAATKAFIVTVTTYDGRQTERHGTGSHRPQIIVLDDSGLPAAGEDRSRKPEVHSI